MFELGTEILEFLNERKNHKKSTKGKLQLHIDFMSSGDILEGVAYLWDIFAKLNGLNLWLEREKYHPIHC